MFIGKFRFAALLLLWSLAPVGAAAEQSHSEWRFRVLLEDREIGHHHFVLEEDEEVRRLSIEADFEVRLLFLKLFEYRHRNEEVWQGNCLASVDSHTDDNGRPYSVRGELQGDRFLVLSTEGSTELPPCVMSFAYWNPEFLEQERLLNTQNGEYLPIEVSKLEPQRGYHGGAARGYRLRAGDLDLLLWYSAQDEWLALETEAPGGRRLRYERM